MFNLINFITDKTFTILGYIYIYLNTKYIKVHKKHTVKGVDTRRHVDMKQNKGTTLNKLPYLQTQKLPINQGKMKTGECFLQRDFYEPVPIANPECT